MKTPQMEESLLQIVEQFVKEEEICSFLVETFSDTTLHLEEKLEASRSVLQASFPNLSESRRECILDAIASTYEKNNSTEEENDELVEQLETKTREGCCQLCGATQRITIHHLIPKLILKRMRNKGKERVDVSKYLVEVCRPCHNELHRLWGHGELAKDYQTVEMILEAPEIQPFLAWKRKRERTLE
eukprot:TRINITY_DN1726_c0_g1_i1.p1 TRINITY_DN1726_c0_g1~~TRINITY_DN1726_c0_g1_i1.p1  ORF type:complete len:187 (-),score=48.01 TRINITY_DN1726_c0_g1_i1:165-725(-)